MNFQGYCTFCYALLLHLGVMTVAFASPDAVKSAYSDSLYLVLNQQPDDSSKVMVYRQLWEYYVYTSPDSSLVLAEKALGLSEKLDYTAGIAWAKAGEGFAFLNLGQNEEAFRSLYEAKTIFDELGNPTDLAYVLNYIGDLHLRIGEYPNALERFYEALQIFEKQGEIEGVAHTQGNLGFAYQKMGDYDKALLNLSRALAVNKDLGLPDEVGIIQVYMGQVYDDQQDHAKALESYFKALENLNEEKFIGLAHVYIGVSYNEISRANRAIAFVKKGIETLRVRGFKNELAEAYRSLSDIYFTEKNFAQSLEYYRLYTTMREDIRSRQSIRVIAEIQARYDAAKQEQENQRLKRKELEKDEELRRKNILVVATTILVLLLIVFIYVLYKNNQQRKASVEKLNSQKEAIREQSEELRHKNEKLEDLGREKDGLISIVAHDLKSPLNKVKGFTQLLPLVGELNEEQTDYIDRINIVVEEGSSLIRDLLDINSIENERAKLEVQPVSIVAFLEETVGQFEQTAKKKELSLVYAHNGEDVSLKTDKKSLARIIDNLISNAIKFSEPHRKVTIEATEDEDLVMISVQDQGPGIEAHLQEKLFKKFQRLNARPTGGETSHGLGLAIVKSLVERLQGDIEVESVLGKGTTFRLIFPKEVAFD